MDENVIRVVGRHLCIYAKGESRKALAFTKITVST